MSEIKLEVGQRVRLKDGEMHVVKANPGSNNYPFMINGYAYTWDGFFHCTRCDHPLNVVEILPPEPAPVPTVEIGKWYPCRDGIHEGKVLEAGLPGIFHLVGVVRRKSEHGSWFLRAWTIEGKSSLRDESDCDLMLTPPEPKRHTVTFWLNFYGHEDGRIEVAGGHDSKEEATKIACHGRIACVPITIEFTEGEGLP